MRKIQTQYFIGTSGWSYPHWQGLFYPQELPQSKWFEHYSRIFSTVEVNATFYRTFKDTTYQKWYQRAPSNFRYVLKAHRIITHRKYLQNAEEEIKDFSRKADLLENKLGMILLQLAPQTPYEPERLKKVLLLFSNPTKVAVEFRHKQWFTQEIQDLLRELGTTICSVDSPKLELIDWLTSNQAYIRLHGRKRWYRYDYSTQELQEVATLAQDMSKRGAETIYIYFNNDFEACAPHNALTLMELLK